MRLLNIRCCNINTAWDLAESSIWFEGENRLLAVGMLEYLITKAEVRRHAPESLSVL